MAERERFELSIPCGMLAFQASALGHYATSPCANGCFIVRGGYRKNPKQSRDEEPALDEQLTISFD